LRTLVAHNGYAYDCLALERDGVVFDYAHVEDTLLAHHAYASHLPQRMDQLVSTYLDSSPWKVTHGRRGQEEKGLLPHQLSPEERAEYNCLMEGTTVVLADGGLRKIEDIVINKEAPLVLSLGPEGIVAKRVVGWSRSHVDGQLWHCIKTAACTTRRGLITTPDHEVYTRRGWVEAQDVIIGDQIAQVDCALTVEQRSALLGTLLGDCSLVASPTQRRLKMWRTAAVVGVHSEDSKLAREKTVALPLFELGGLSEQRGSYRNVKPTRRFGTRMRHDLALLRPLLYDANGKRRLRTEVLDLLGPIGLAWWFADDGCRASDSVRLALCRYPREDVERTRAWFMKRFGHAAIYNGKAHDVGNGSLGLSKEASAKFCEYIAPYLLPSARYKLPCYREWPKYNDTPLPTANAPVFADVEVSSPYNPPRNHKWQRYNAGRRWCITVEDTHNFFTTHGLVANSKDCRLESALWDVLQIDLEPERHVYEHDKRLALLCAGMTKVGIRVDVDRQRELSQKLRYRMAALLGEMRSLTRKQSFSPMKPAHIRKALYDTFGAPMIGKPTDTGLAPTSKFVLQALRGQDTRAGRLADLILRYRKARKARSTYVDSLDIYADGRVHYAWKAFGTVSGRLASRFQQLPKQTKKNDIVDRIRELYVPESGYEFVYFDLSQAEMRCASQLSGDEKFMAICAQKDVHSANACLIFPHAADAIRNDPKGEGKLYRDIAKNVGFAVNYLAGEETLFLYLQGQDLPRPVTMREVRAMLAVVRREFRKHFAYIEANVVRAQRYGFIRSPVLGRIRWVGWNPKPAEVANAPVQACVADEMNRRLIGMAPKLPKESRLVAQIHDAAIFEARKGTASRLTRELVKETWEEPVVLPESGRTFVLPIDQKSGERLSELG
jgi:DNA polymerase I-like protein with 3'-5' exonuclease and polymerase domains